MSLPTRPRYYLFGFSPQAVFILLPCLAFGVLVLSIFFLVPLDQQSTVAENVGRLIGWGFVNALVFGWMFMAVHSLVSLMIGGLFAGCYLLVIRLNSLRL